MKISILGVGRVGSAVAFALVSKGIPDELVLYDRVRDLAAGDAHDLTHAAAFSAHNMLIRAGDVEDTHHSDLLIFCLSVPWGKQYQTRSDLARGNSEIFQAMIPEVARNSPNAILLVVSNPVDAMTYLALQLSGFPANRVLGTGTLLDSARYRALLSQQLGIHPDDVRAYILGEHGDTQFPALSLALTGGQRVDQSSAAQEMFEETVRSGYKVVEAKGFSNYAIALAVSLIVESIARDERRTIPVSTLINGFCGVRDVCLSIPCVVGKDGIVRHLEPLLSAQEQEAFRLSAQAVQETINACCL